MFYQRVRVQLGVRASGNFFTGSSSFVTAPASLRRGQESLPSLFASLKEQNLDTLTVTSASIGSINLYAGIQAVVYKKLYAGFNLDFAGVGFGRAANATFASNGVAQTNQPLTVAHGNILLIGDSDIGQLNSSFYLGYQAKPNVAFQLGFNHLFSEVRTSATEQAVGNVTNRRFRNISNAITAGVAITFGSPQE